MSVRVYQIYSKISKSNPQFLLGFTTRWGGWEAAAASSLSNRSWGIAETWQWRISTWPLQSTKMILNSLWQFSSIREGVTLLGSTITPRWTCQEMITCAGVIPSSFAIALTCNSVMEMPITKKNEQQTNLWNSKCGSNLLSTTKRRVRFKLKVVLFRPLVQMWAIRHCYATK